MAAGVGKLRQVFNRTVSEVAQELGKSDQWVYHMEKILELPEALRQRVHQKDVSVDAAFLLADDPNHEAVVSGVLAAKKEKAAKAPKTPKAAKNGNATKKPKVTKKDVAQAKAKEKVAKLVPPTLAGVKKAFNDCDLKAYLPVGPMLKFLAGELSTEKLVGLAVLIED